MSERVAMGLWALYHALVDSYTATAYWNPATLSYEIVTPKGDFTAKRLRELEAQVREVYPALQIVDYPPADVIRRAELFKPVAPP